jgi:hypothetical protein
LLPLFPVTVNWEGPFGAVRFTLIVKVEEPGAVAVLELKVALVLGGRPLMLRLTELDAPMAASVIVSMPVDPRDIVRVAGEAEMVKSAAGGGGGAGTVTEKVVECVRAPLVPVMVYVYVPAAVPAATLTVKLDVVDEPLVGVTEAGLSEHVIGPEQVVLRVTRELNPLSEVTVTVAGELDVPAGTVIGDGLSERPKSGLAAAPH